MSRKSHVTETDEYADYSKILIKMARDSCGQVDFYPLFLQEEQTVEQSQNSFRTIFILYNSLNVILMNKDMQIGRYSDSVMSILNHWDTNLNVFWYTEQRQIFHTQRDQTWSFKGTASTARFSALYQVSRLYDTSQSSSQGMRTFMTPAKKKEESSYTCSSEKRDGLERWGVSCREWKQMSCVWVWKQICDGELGKHKSFLKACRPASYCCQN